VKTKKPSGRKLKYLGEQFADQNIKAKRDNGRRRYAHAIKVKMMLKRLGL